MGISLTGLATSLDTDALIDSFMSIERRPRIRVATQQSTERANKVALQTVQDSLKKLRAAAQALADPALFANRQSVDVANASTATATLVSGAAAGGYQLQVDQLARASQASYAYTAPTADGTITVSGTGWSDAISLSAGTSASDLVDRINGDSSLHVVASVTTVNGVERVSFASRDTGANSGFTASAAGVLSDESLTAGLDASIRIDGTTHTSGTNVVEDAIPGVRLKLRGLDTAGTTVTVGSPGADTKVVGDAAKEFVDAYNASNDLLRKLTSVTTTAKGQLGGDQTLTTLATQLRTAMFQVTNGTTSLPLEDLGISAGKASGTATYSADAVAGKLTLDADALSAAVEADAAGVSGVLSDPDGVLKSMASMIGSYTGANGSLTTRISDTDRMIADLGKRMDDFDARLTVKQAALKAQFARLESTISQLNDQQSWLSGQLNALKAS